MVAEKGNPGLTGRIGDIVGRWGTPGVAAGRNGRAGRVGLVARVAVNPDNGVGSSVEGNMAARTALGCASHPTSVANSRGQGYDKATTTGSNSV